ncbi:MAG: O-antigen ligase family protein [Saprospiraceae bacterium]
MNHLDFALIIYLGVVCVTSFFAKNYQPFLEFFGLVYLFLNYLIIRLFLISTEIKLKDFISKGIIWMGNIAAFFGIIGIATTYFSGDNLLGYTYQDYPYFGDTIRISGLTSTPHMLASILNLSILFLFVSILEKRDFKKLILLLIFSVAYIFTFAKIVVLLLIGIIFIFLKKQKHHLSPIFKNSLRLISLTLFMIYLFGTHFILVNKNNPNLKEIRESAFNSGKIVGETQHNFIIPSTYFTLKQSAIFIGKEKFLTGVGAGNHGTYFHQLKEANFFPKHIPDYDPHSTYFGSFAETGIFGLSAILYLTFVLFKISNHLLKTKKHDNLKIVVTGYLLIFFMEAVSVDAINFRHLWLVLAILSAIYNLEQNENSVKVLT